MDIRVNKRGMYEYILTKSIMLIFILSLVYLFYSFYNTLNIQSGGTVIQSEAQRIAKVIDDTIGFTGIETKNVILLNNQLMVGKELVPYDLTIDSQKVVIKPNHPRYRDLIGVAEFGHGNFNLVNGNPIDCTWSQIEKAAQIVISKQDRFYYVPSAGEGKMMYEIIVKIDAIGSGGSIGCGDYMELSSATEW